MKKITSITVLSLSVLLILGCGKVVEESELNLRDGKFYPINSDKPYSGKIVSYYENGQIESSKNYKGGLLDGLSEWYLKNGRLKFSLNYKVEEFFREDGTLEQLHTYENEELSKVEFFREDGTLEEIQTYENGEKTKTEFFREDGTLEKSLYFKDGVLID